MEDIISFIDGKLFGEPGYLTDSDYAVRLQNVESYARAVFGRSPDRTIQGASVQTEKGGIFISFDNAPDAQTLGTHIADIERKYPVDRKTTDRITRQKSGNVRLMTAVEGITMHISRRAPPASSRWFIAAFLLFLVVMGVFVIFARNLAPVEDFASLRLYFKRG